jgi:hypothetical protein
MSRLGLLAVAMALGMAVAAPAAAAPAAAPAPDAAAAVVEPFYADSGDACVYGHTRGQLGWELLPPPRYLITVAVRGVVVDRPTANDPRACPNDSHYTMATFTAFAGRTVVASDARRVNDSTLTFGFVLGANSNVAFDRVVVQVCRISLLPRPSDYCGTPQEYRAPVRITG